MNIFKLILFIYNTLGLSLYVKEYYGKKAPLIVGLIMYIALYVVIALA